MRRHLAAFATLGTLLVAAGCSDGDTSTSATPAAGAPGSAAATTAAADPAVAASAASAAASADAALGGNTKAICDQAARTSTGFGETFVADLKLQIDATSKGAAAKTQADQKIARDVQNYSYALADMAKLTTDPALKKALTSMSKQVTALKGDVSKIDPEKMSELTAGLDKACGKG
jgi:hypothetical protein